MLVIFDWDGTISDSTQKIVLCMQRAASDIGLPKVSNLDVRNIIGLGLPEAIAQLYPEISAADSECLRRCYSQHFIDEDQYPSAWYDGAEQAIEHLLAKGYRIAVATGKSRRGLDRVFSELGIGDLFHGSRCADETASKPDPLMLHELLVEMDCEAGDAFMVGDTTYDMEMAQRAGVPRIAVSHGAHELERLKVFDPVLCIDHFDELIAWFS